ncbi:hypothetical protein [Cohnella abietis]|uniref:Uncharacterized protein n=1 Tax=Cohnella abietis TaxID=2507935 RepID=A0A3T1D2U2_9BACL|nr:hypothetical protein [Cohnella abietis]BBI32368.1 hypothetical protein KCTCHS21_17670 [Cohnella abietis]
MAKIINITDKFSSEQPVIQIGEKEYPIEATMEAVFMFEEKASQGNRGAFEAIEAALGKEATIELNLNKLTVKQFKVLTTAIAAAMQDMTYEEAAARFQTR